LAQVDAKSAATEVRLAGHPCHIFYVAYLLV